jgi:hypothetical protein
MTSEEIKNFIFYLDGLKYSFQMADLAFQRLKSTLDEIAQNHAAGQYTEYHVTSCLLDAWTLVDMCHRIRSLVQQTPGLSHKTLGIQIFLRGTQKVDNLRNYVQHFRNGIPKIPLQSFPLWGVLSWVPSHDIAICYTIASGNLVGGVSAPSIPFDLKSWCFTAEIKLYANATEVDLCEIAAKMTEVQRCIIEWLDQQPNVKRLKGKTMVTAYKAIKPPAPPV